MANTNNWGEIYKSTWWGDEDWSANSLKIDSAPPGFAGQNLLRGSEDLDNTIDWDRLPDTTDVPSVSANIITDPNGGTTAERVDFTANRQARLQQRVTLEASKEYTFSVYAKVNTGTQNFRLRNVTLGDAESKTATTSWTRFSYTFTTTTAGDYDLSLQNNDNTARTLEFWGAMLNEGATAGDYVKTDGSFSGSAPAPAYSGFGDAFGGVTAYYSLRQFTEAETLNAIRVRRSSDDTEEDIGFDANGDLDTTALTTFVNAERDIFTSDFPNGTTAGSGDGSLGATRTTLTAPSSIGGQTDALQVTCDGTTSFYDMRVNSIDSGQQHDVSFEYYIPSGNTIVEGIRFTDLSGVGTFSTKGAWTSVTLTDKTATNDILRFFAADSGGGTSIGSGVTESFYIRNLSVSQTTADGAVTTFYDQTGNGNDATNSTESEQPLVVSGGTLVEENSKPAIDFDGVDDLLRSTLTIGTSQTDWGWFGVFTTGSNISSNNCVYGGRTSSGNGAIAFIGSNNLNVRTDGTSSISGAVTANTQFLATQLQNSTSHDAYINGSTIGTASSVAMTNTTNAITLGSVAYADALFLSGNQQEMIFFKSDQSGNRTSIESNINDHFDIYTP